MEWIKMIDRKPPHYKRVLTYSPSYHGARQRFYEGVSILTLHPESEDVGNPGWVDDNGEMAMFKPVLWAELPYPEHNDVKHWID